MAFCPSPLIFLSGPRKHRGTTLCCKASEESAKRISRRNLLRIAAATALAYRSFHTDGGLAAEDENTASIENATNGPIGFLTKSGLKYFDFNVGTGARPNWGDIIRIHYVAYTISPDGLSLRKEDSTYGRNKDAGFLIHHGNGEMVWGLEEGLHSMAVGGRRRMIIPPQIAYNDIDLGPVPSASWTRRRFSNHLTEGGGTVVFDVELLSVAPDPDDRGYYDDLTPNNDEIRQMAEDARQEYAEQLRAQGIEPPDPNERLSEFKLNEPGTGPAKSIISTGPPVGTNIQQVGTSQ